MAATLSSVLLWLDYFTVLIKQNVLHFAVCIKTLFFYQQAVFIKKRGLEFHFALVSLFKRLYQALFVEESNVIRIALTF